MPTARRNCSANRPGRHAAPVGICTMSAHYSNLRGKPCHRREPNPKQACVVDTIGFGPTTWRPSATKTVSYCSPTCCNTIENSAEQAAIISMKPKNPFTLVGGTAFSAKSANTSAATTKPPYFLGYSARATLGTIDPDWLNTVKVGRTLFDAQIYAPPPEVILHKGRKPGRKTRGAIKITSAEKELVVKYAPALIRLIWHSPLVGVDKGDPDTVGGLLVELEKCNMRLLAMPLSGSVEDQLKLLDDEKAVIERYKTIARNNVLLPLGGCRARLTSPLALEVLARWPHLERFSQLFSLYNYWEVMPPELIAESLRS